MGYVTWSFETLNRFCRDAFGAFGFSEEESGEITDVLLKADLYGIESHGMQRMVRYHKGIEKGTIHPEARPEVVFETPVSAVIDGHSGMGQLISIFAMKKAIEKAKTTGVGISELPDTMRRWLRMKAFWAWRAQTPRRSWCRLSAEKQCWVPIP